jgi:hypothetical protein
MKFSALLFVILLVGACSREGSESRPISITAVVPREFCQPRFSQDGAFCEMQRCDVEMPCATEDDQDCDDVLDYGNAFDNCVYICNPEQENADGDYMGDACDPCPNDPANDTDKDGVCGNPYTAAIQALQAVAADHELRLETIEASLE